MPQDNTLTNNFKNFAQCINSTNLNCESEGYKIDSFTKIRIVLGRLYYACFHKGLEDFEFIRNSKRGNKHQRLIKALGGSSNPNHQKLYNLLTKLYDLRVWADYDYTNEFYTNVRPGGVGYYMFQVDLLLSENSN